MSQAGNPNPDPFFNRHRIDRALLDQGKQQRGHKRLVIHPEFTEELSGCRAAMDDARPRSPSENLPTISIRARSKLFRSAPRTGACTASRTLSGSREAFPGNITWVGIHLYDNPENHIID